MVYKDVDVDIVVTPIISYTDIVDKPILNGFELNGDVTLENIGLGNIDNTSDLDKPISTATQEALDLKEDKETVLGIKQDLVELNTTVDGITTELSLKQDKGDYALKSEIPDISNLPTRDELNSALASKANKSTTLSGYGIVDAYSKDESDGKFATKEQGEKADTAVQPSSIADMLTKTDANGIFVKISSLSAVATTGSYNDLKDTPKQFVLNIKWFSGISGTTLDISPIESTRVYKVYKNGLLLEPSIEDKINDYSMSGTTITFTTELLDGDKIAVEHTV